MSRGRDFGESLNRGGELEPLGRGGRSSQAIAPHGRTLPEHRTDLNDVLRRDLDLPRTTHREPVTVRNRSVTLRDSEVRILATVGAFRVVDAQDLAQDRPEGRPSTDRWHGDLEHLREQRLVTVMPHVLHGERTALVTLTADGRALLEEHRSKHPSVVDQQQYYDGLVKPREVTHDAQLLRLYQSAAERLHAQGAHVRRVVLDYELRRDYQRFLQDRNRNQPSANGKPNRSREEVRAWADANHLRVVDGMVRFSDVRIEYEHPDGRPDREDLELATEHYNARQMATKTAAGFVVHRSTAGRLGGGGTARRLGGGSGKRGKAPFDPGGRR